MRHRKSNIKLGRTASHRDAMLRNMVTSLFEHERITTTLVKAKALRPLADKMIGWAKKGDLHSMRLAASVLQERSEYGKGPDSVKKPVKLKILNKICEIAQERYTDRVSGFTTIIKIGPRKGDAAPMAIVELIQPDHVKAAVGGGAKKVKTKTADRSKRVAASKAVEKENTTVDEVVESEAEVKEIDAKEE